MLLFAQSSVLLYLQPSVAHKSVPIALAAAVSCSCMTSQLSIAIIAPVAVAAAATAAVTAAATSPTCSTNAAGGSPASECAAAACGSGVSPGTSALTTGYDAAVLAGSLRSVIVLISKQLKLRPG
jgi:hypothetical protein